MRVAVVGAGISGLTAAFELAKAGAEVVVYEKEDHLGGHARTVTVDGIDLDLGFMVFNRVTYPNMLEMFEKLGVEMETSDMSFSVSLDEGKGCEWGSRNGFASLFAQKSNLLNPYFWLMLREIIKFKDDAHRYLTELEENPDIHRNETLEDFIKSHGYSKLFQEAYIVPICASIWSCPMKRVMNFSAYSVLSFCRNHHLLQGWCQAGDKNKNPYVLGIFSSRGGMGALLLSDSSTAAAAAQQKGHGHGDGHRHRDVHGDPSSAWALRFFGGYGKYT